MPTSEITAAATSAIPLHSPLDEALAQLAHGTETERKATERAQAIVGIVAALTDDEDIRRGAALYPLMEAGCIEQEQAATRFGAVPEVIDALTSFAESRRAAA